VMSEAIDVYTRHGKVAPQAMKDLYVATFQLPPVVEGLGNAFKHLGTEVDLVAPKLQEFPLKVTEGWKNIGMVGTKVALPTMKEVQKLTETGLDRFDTGLKGISKSFTQLAQVSGDSFGGVTKNIATSTSTLETGISGFKGLKGGIMDLMGKGAAGGAAGGSGILGMVGSIGMMATGIGALLPVGIAAFKGLKKVFSTAGRDVVKDFAGTFKGGFDELHQQLQTLGAEGEDLWVKLTQKTGKKDKAGAEAVVKEIQEALAAGHEKLNESLAEDLKGLQDFGGQIPDALQPYIDTLLHSKDISQENIDLLKSMTEGGSVDWKKMQDAADKYGISLDTLGPKFQAQKLHDAWQQIIDDGELLLNGGADIDSMLHGMSDEISGLVNDSRKFGTAIPENMRPWIEKLIASGELLDENGNKITDINSLTFGESLQSSVSKLVDSIQKLVDTLGGVPKAISAIPKNVDVDVNYRQHGRADENGDTTPRFATGVENFHGGWALVGERGPELVNLPRGSDVIPNARLGGVTINVPMTTYLTPQQVTQAVQTALQRAGVR